MAQLRPTFSESWYRVTGLKARLRGSTQISRQHYRGERWYVVRDPAGNQYHRLSSAAYRFVGLLDGSRTVGEAWDLVGGQLADDAPTQPEVIQILSQLHAANLLEANITADAEGGKVVALADPGAIANLRSCTRDTCRIRGEAVDGWISKSRIWGVGVDEVFDRVQVRDGELKGIHSFYYPQPIPSSITSRHSVNLRRSIR